MSRTAALFITFGILGIFGEVVFTALISIFKTRRLRLFGFSFLWMFPVYGLVAIMGPPLFHHASHFPLVIRGLIYMLVFYAVEYISGTVLTALTGSHIWQYTDKWNYKGQITLLYIPVWFSLGLAIEKYYPLVDRISHAVAASLY